MRKFISLVVVALLPALAQASDVAELMEARAEVRPVVSVIALSAEQARQLAEVRSKYQALIAKLEAEQEARVNAILARTSTES